MHNHPSKKSLESLVKRFNRDFPVGTEVFLRKDSGEVRTRIGSPAYMLGGHSPVAMFDGVSGAYSIEDNRVRRVVCTCGADRTGPSAEAHDKDCPASFEYRLEVSPAP